MDSPVREPVAGGGCPGAYLVVGFEWLNPPPLLPLKQEFSGEGSPT